MYEKLYREAVDSPRIAPRAVLPDLQHMPAGMSSAWQSHFGLGGLLRLNVHMPLTELAQSRVCIQPVPKGRNEMLTGALLLTGCCDSDRWCLFMQRGTLRKGRQVCKLAQWWLWQELRAGVGPASYSDLWVFSDGDSCSPVLMISVSWVSPCMTVSTPGTCRGQKRASESLELESQRVKSHHVAAGNQTQIFCKSKFS